MDNVLKETISIEIIMNLTEVKFLDVTFSLERKTCQQNKKPNDSLTNINTSSNHPPQTIKHIPQNISETLSKNVLSAEIIEQSKPDYKKAPKNVVTKQNYKTHNQICGKITREEGHKKSFGQTYLSV